MSGKLIPTVDMVAAARNDLNSQHTAVCWLLFDFRISRFRTNPVTASEFPSLRMYDQWSNHMKTKMWLLSQ